MLWWRSLRQALLPVRGVDSELGDGEETGPFRETDADGVGVDFVETVHLHAALSRCGPVEDRMPGTFVEIFNDIFLHHAGLWFGHHYHVYQAAWVELDFPERLFDFWAGDPAGAEVVVVGEVHDVHVVGPG